MPWHIECQGRLNKFWPLKMANCFVFGNSQALNVLWYSMWKLAPLALVTFLDFLEWSKLRTPRLFILSFGLRTLHCFAKLSNASEKFSIWRSTQTWLRTSKRILTLSAFVRVFPLSESIDKSFLKSFVLAESGFDTLR